ncbi:hypothetical protein FF38_09554 [Lucilia cuprina]|uniref:Uncharacterized protein n=1 Tax=Lucilia cuprina TaxID=7375 RepID=A0A0L0CCX2_LUCCU|nr:hypothetical protein CVS40_8536 [Lucilia cuprina]KNC30081.1 hypothetical protein FF38_09554 [Lucilia cuprina]
MKKSHNQTITIKTTHILAKLINQLKLIKTNTLNFSNKNLKKMFKFFVFAALFALAAARPGYLASSSPVVYSSHYVQPVHYSVPVVKTVVHKTVVPVVHTQVVKTVVSTPVVHAAPVVHASPLYHSVPVVSSYAPAYGAWKK